MEDVNTIFHVTHWKAGSQWIHKILLELFPERIVSPRMREKQFLDEPLRQGYVYPTVYVTREQFFSVDLPSHYKKIVIIRDLRDTLVSGYFSVRYSHALIDDALIVWRKKLDSVSLEEGLLLLIDEWLPSSAKVQSSWLSAREDIIRYEDLLSKDVEILGDFFINKCGLNLSRKNLEAVIKKHRFAKVTNGRLPGKENIFSHERKGIAGDWKNYFSPLVSKKFNQLYGDLLAQAGYEESHLL